MSDTVRDRIAVLQHKRRQSASHQALSSISDKLGEPHHVPVEPGRSLQVQGDLYAKLKAMRARGALQSRTFAEARVAVDEFLERTAHLGPDRIFEFSVGARGSGFFRNPLSHAFLMSCLQEGHEGVAVVQPGLDAGVVLDVALDDPMRGDFYEIEWW